MPPSSPQNSNPPDSPAPSALPRRSERERLADAKTKSGVFTGATAINPANGAALPVWIAAYGLLRLVEVFRDGELLVRHDLEAVRTRAAR